ncbi:hypothetical protein MD484_g7723, partial [Candolleomyces efflorescens]
MSVPGDTYTWTQILSDMAQSLALRAPLVGPGPVRRPSARTVSNCAKRIWDAKLHSLLRPFSITCSEAEKLKISLPPPGLAGVGHYPLWMSPAGLANPGVLEGLRMLVAENIPLPGIDEGGEVVVEQWLQDTIKEAVAFCLILVCQQLEGQLALLPKEQSDAFSMYVRGLRLTKRQSSTKQTSADWIVERMLNYELKSWEFSPTVSRAIEHMLHAHDGVRLSADELWKEMGSVIGGTAQATLCQVRNYYKCLVFHVFFI